MIEEESDFQTLEVAHILPHSLTKTNPLLCPVFLTNHLPM